MILVSILIRFYICRRYGNEIGHQKLVAIIFDEGTTKNENFNFSH
jgi:hypothetical protein